MRYTVEINIIWDTIRQWNLSRMGNSSSVDLASSIGEGKNVSSSSRINEKNVECAFGILIACFEVVTTLTHLWEQSGIINIMTRCIIKHNMIVKDECHLGPMDAHEFEQGRS